MFTDQGSKTAKPTSDRTANADAPQAGQGITAPSISLPKGGGAIRGMGEKFAANPVTGTGSMSVPIATSPGRGGFGPQLALAYDSGAGNGPFGFGWNLSLPSITRKTDKGLPRYLDTEASDVFLLAGAEDLVPVLIKEREQWQRESVPPRTVNDQVYQIQRYRPRIEGLFARIERWTNQDDAKDSFWRSISKDNITTWYGKSANSRIADPADLTHIFTWLICESYDDKGNAIVYTYQAEDASGVDRTATHERNRLTEATFAQRYLKHIHYGNRTPHQANEDLQQRADWMFEVVFDYGEHHEAAPLPVESGRWTVRADAFSTCRAGFEVRTYRLCRRVLMFHHFPAQDATDVDAAAVGQNCLVRATEFSHEQTPVAAYLVAATQAAFRRNGAGYTRRSLPPLQFEYSKAQIQAALKTVDATSIENLPTGIDGTHYQFVDLYGEGISGVLTQQAEGWFYKRNLSPLTMRTVYDANGNDHIAIDARFTPTEPVALRPSPGNLAGGQQLMDLDGDGRTDLVQFAPPLAGYSAQNSAGGWQPFVAFRSQPNLDWQDPNLRHVELTGDGHADLLITRAAGFEWYRSLEKEGFEPALFVTQPLDDEQGPRLVFADGTQSVYLADMNGDGLTDLVRIRNGNVCYWPSLGYGRFGAKVSMSHAPHFDHPDQFDHQRIRIADIDGSGVADILYIGRHAIQVYRNESGNRWADADVISAFPRVDNLASVQAMDLLGNGTACLVWSSPLSNDARQPLRYLDLLGGQKPHLLVKTSNNLGAETRVEYAPSTKFYLQDKYAGKPWITKLPFPVHVVEKVTVTDKWRKTTFSSRYSYHHGYFDGNEREFRGFGRVEQVDVEDYDTFAAGNSASPYITADQTLYQPPVKTITWFHTGAFLDREQILSQFQQEYFAPRSAHFQENELPQPDLANLGLSTAEWREALRACKGMTLRQEVYELDVDALEAGQQRPVKLFSTAFHNCHIQRLQPRTTNPHAVFLVTESEAITYTYELDLRPATLTPDPRIAHSLNLKTDEFGNVQQAVAAVYSRIGRHVDPSLPAGAETLINEVQAEMHLAYTETRYTNDVDNPTDRDNYRLRVPCEVLTYELTSLRDGRDNHYFTLAELRGYRLSEVHQATGTPVAEIAYHVIANHTTTPTPQKRCVEHVRMLFFRDDPTEPLALQDPLALGQLGRLGLPYETYKLALTDALLNAVFADATGNKLDRPVGDTTPARQLLADEAVSGYLSGADLVARFTSIPAAELAGQYWMRSGIAGFADNAAQHFYLPKRYTDAFGNDTTLDYDSRDLFIQSSRDALGNRSEVTHFDFRVLAPQEMRDPNDNLSEVSFDILGMPAAMAVKGKRDEGDNLAGVPIDLAIDTLIDFFNGDYTEDTARRLLGNATARHLYHFGERHNPDGSITWGIDPACACAILRERHVAALHPGEPNPLQVAFAYSDGGGNVLVTKQQAEPATAGGPLRWIANGKTVLNNKGKPVKQYEPYFSSPAVAQRFAEPSEEGVTPIIYYDAAGRTVRTEMPDGSYSRVEFSPWQVATYDANDTVLEAGNAWYVERSPLDPTQPLPRSLLTGEPTATPDQRAAWLAAQHAATPAITVLDSLGRNVIAIAHNRTPDDGGVWRDARYLTFTKLDAEGKPLWIRDAHGNLVMQYITPTKPTRAIDELDQRNIENTPLTSVPTYDIAGNLLFQHSMDAGDRWMLLDAAGKPFYAWNENARVVEDGALLPERRQFHTTYDELHRPLEQRLQINGARSQMIERFVYGDRSDLFPARLADPLPEAQARNLRGQVYQHYDASGLITNQRFDFKGNLQEVTQQLTQVYNAPVIDWAMETRLAETFTQRTETDALSRMTRLENWHLADRPPAIYTPQYNQRGVLQSETLTVRGAVTEAILNIEYDAKGQRTRIDYGNSTTTRYDYDPETFRLRQLRTTRPEYDPPFPGHHSGLQDDHVLQQLSYTYDPVGNITEIYDEAYEPVYFRNQEVHPRSRYTYDALYRLIEATGRENATAIASPPPRQNSPDYTGFPVPVPDPDALRNYRQQYQYDAVGNIDEMQHVTGPTGSWTRRYAYATDSNRLLRTWEGAEHWEDAAATHKVTYRYDTHGSMLNLANVPEEYRLRWDYRDMIHTANLIGGGHAFYNYDAGKQRTRKRVERNGNTVEERLYLGGMELYCRWVGGNLVEEIETSHLFADDQRILIVEDVLSTNNPNLSAGVLFRYQYGNHLGSVGLELDGNAAVISYEEYHPYGTTAYRATNAAVRAAAKRYRYTGMERDEETGFNYHGARYYAPWLGRWVSCDPAELVDGSNLYQCVRGNPLLLTDSAGTQSHPITITGGGFVQHGSVDGRTARITTPFEVTGTAESSAPPPPPPPTTSTLPSQQVAPQQDDTSIVVDIVRGGGQGVIESIPFFPHHPTSIHEDHSRAFQISRGMARSVAGVLEIIGGQVIESFGVGLAGGGGVAEVPSGGMSTVVVIAGVAVVAGGRAVSVAGVANAAVGVAGVRMAMTGGSGGSSPRDAERHRGVQELFDEAQGRWHNSAAQANRGVQPRGAFPSSPQHHLIPQELLNTPSIARLLKRRGIDIHDFTVRLSQGDHSAIHTSRWNPIWRQFFREFPRATRGQILRQMNRMRRAFRIQGLPLERYGSG